MRSDDLGKLPVVHPSDESTYKVIRIMKVIERGAYSEMALETDFHFVWLALIDNLAYRVDPSLRS